MTVFSLTKLDSVSHNNLKQNVTIDASSLKIQSLQNWVLFFSLLI